MSREALTAGEIRELVRRVQAGEDRGDVAARFRVSRATVLKHVQRADLQRLPHRGADLTWMRQAACRGLPDFTDWPVRNQVTVCRGGGGCPVRLECLEYGLRERIVMGKSTEGPVYGGLSPRRLGELQRERQDVAS